jgi:hypothetical protein
MSRENVPTWLAALAAPDAGASPAGASTPASGAREPRRAWQRAEAVVDATLERVAARRRTSGAGESR